jgi:ribosome recycling factor
MEVLMMPVDKVLTDCEANMKKSVQALQDELATIRTGRASPALIEHLHVEAYGVATPLNQLGSISAPEARMLLVQPWDQKMVGAIEKAILKSDLGLNPTNDGRVIRVMIPYLSEDRRRDLIKVTHKKVEEGRVIIRARRHDALTAIEHMQKNKEISEDDMKRGKDRLQKITDFYVAKVEEVGALKEQEILEV